MKLCLCLLLLAVRFSSCQWNPLRPLESCSDLGWVWGEEDERGANNYQGPEKALDAASLIRTGKVYDLTFVYNPKMWLFGERVYSLMIPNSPIAVFGENGLGFNDEILITNIGQVGTQFDGLGHIMTVEKDSNDRDTYTYYNGYSGDDVHSPYGLKKLGVHNLVPYFTRGILIDFARCNDVDILPNDHVIRKDEFFDCLRDQGLRIADITEGSIVVIHTGTNKIRDTDPDTYGSLVPGIDLDVLYWLIEQHVSVIGADAAGPFIVPNPDHPTTIFPDHQLAIVCAGIAILEQMNTQSLADDRVYEFAWAYSPIPFEGATGAPGGGMALA